MCPSGAVQYIYIMRTRSARAPPGAGSGAAGTNGPGRGIQGGTVVVHRERPVPAPTVPGLFTARLALGRSGHRRSCPRRRRAARRLAAGGGGAPPAPWSSRASRARLGGGRGTRPRAPSASPSKLTTPDVRRRRRACRRRPHPRCCFRRSTHSLSSTARSASGCALSASSRAHGCPRCSPPWPARRSATGAWRRDAATECAQQPTSGWNQQPTHVRGHPPAAACARR